MTSGIKAYMMVGETLKERVSWMEEVFGGNGAVMMTLSLCGLHP